MIKPFLVATLFSLGFALFEAAILSNLLFLPVMPDFLLLCTLYFSVQNGTLFGTANGFVSGVFLDFLSASPFGLHCLLRTVLGYVGGRFHKTLNIGGVLLPMLLGLVATLLKALAIWLISLFFPLGIQTYHLISARFAAELVCNAVLAPVTFRFLDLFARFTAVDVESVA
ncbi:MAG: rod shape-determining protein MreD [Treponemataceae bacterium]|nr:rod shape-determining protein MreD [Treponemataceae bacterium]